MTPATRGLWSYGLLLVLPALAVGALALGLLARERVRLEERETTAREARRSAVETRARLIAENIELLVGDVQSALMATLQEAPADEPRPFLDEWRATNPLVREIFRAAADGRPLWGGASDPLRAWLARGAPWSEAAPVSVASPATPPPAAMTTSGFAELASPALSAPPSAAVEARKQLDATAAANAQARGEITYNVQQYQRARQEIQEVAKLKQAPVGVAPPAPLLAPEKRGLAGGDGQRSAATTVSPQSWETRVEYHDFTPTESAPRVQDFTAAPLEAPALGAATVSFAPALTKDPLTRSGWTPWRDASGLHLFGWRELPDRTVIGLALRLDAIKARLGEVFPAAPEAGDAYALRDAEGRAWHQVGPADLPVALEVPLATSALPGWSVVARMDAGGPSASASNGVFALGALLVGLLVLAILSSGALLVRQVRASEAEAAKKTSFVANVSHELKTPLTTIRLYAELLAQGRVRDETKRADYLDTIGLETERLARLVNNVLDFSRLEQGRKKYERVAMDLAVELHRLAETHAPRLSACGLSLRLRIPESLPLVTDRDAVEQILLNLFDNACKYAAAGGEVELSLEADGAEGAARVCVADRGPGVPGDQRERIFEKFHRVDDRLTAEKGGAGLGLGIARQLARGLDGDLRCEARPGGGAEFVLLLPLSP